jgi:hypothetical protein
VSKSQTWISLAQIENLLLRLVKSSRIFLIDIGLLKEVGSEIMQLYLSKLLAEIFLVVTTTGYRPSLQKMEIRMEGSKNMNL